MRRSLTSAATRFASSRRAPRNTSRLVSRTAIPPTWVSIWARSSNVIGRFLMLSKSKRGAGSLSPPTWNLQVPPVRLACRRTLSMIHRLFGRRLHRYDGDVGAALGFGAVRHATVDQRKQRVIPAQADVFARMPFGSVLAHNDIASTARLAAEQFHAEALARGIAAVARGSACFLVRHRGLPSRIVPARGAGSLPHPTLPRKRGRVGWGTRRSRSQPVLVKSIYSFVLVNIKPALPSRPPRLAAPLAAVAGAAASATASCPRSGSL